MGLRGSGPQARRASLRRLLRPSQTGVEKACIMDAKFANHRQIGGHFGGVVRGDDDRFAADENIERAGVKDDPAGVCVHLFPVVRRVVVVEFDRSITPVWGLAR